MTTTATTITIDEVDMTKTIVLSNSKGSAGQVAARGSINLSGRATPTGAQVSNYFRGEGINFSNQETSGSYWPYENLSLSGSLTGGTTDLTTKQYSARLTAENQLECDGAIEWQVIQYN